MAHHSVLNQNNRQIYKKVQLFYKFVNEIKSPEVLCVYVKEIPTHEMFTKRKK